MEIIGSVKWFNHIENASDVGARKLGFSPEKSFKGIASAEATHRWKFIHKSISMDLGLGIFYAVLHEFFYTMFARKEKQATASSETVTVTPQAEIQDIQSSSDWVGGLPARKPLQGYNNQVQAVQVSRANTQLAGVSP